MSWFQCQHHMYVCIYNVKPCRSIVWSFPLRTLNNNWRQSASFLPQMTNWWAACVDFKAPVQILWHSPSCTWSQKSIRRELYRNCNYHLAFRKYILSTKRNSYSTEQFSDSSRWLLWVSMKCRYLLSMYDFGGKEQLRLWPRDFHFCLQTYSFLQRRNSLFITGWVSNVLPHNLKPRNSSAFLNRPFLGFFLVGLEVWRLSRRFGFSFHVKSQSQIWCFSGCSMLSTLINWELRPLAGAMEGSRFWCQDDVVAWVRQGDACKRMCVAQIEIGSFVHGWGSTLHY